MVTEQDKQILFQDLCARLPYGVQLKVTGGEFDLCSNNYLLTAISKFGLETRCKVYHPIYTPMGCPNIDDVKPYLRPMSSMTDEECKEFFIQREKIVTIGSHQIILDLDSSDWLNKHHFDYRNLIEKGLALPAPPDMYKFD